MYDAVWISREISSNYCNNLQYIKSFKESQRKKFILLVLTFFLYKTAIGKINLYKMKIIKCI